jgi:hypothetical protein
MRWCFRSREQKKQKNRNLSFPGEPCMQRNRCTGFDQIKWGHRFTPHSLHSCHALALLVPSSQDLPPFFPAHIGLDNAAPLAPRFSDPTARSLKVQSRGTRRHRRRRPGRGEDSETTLNIRTHECHSSANGQLTRDSRLCVCKPDCTRCGGRGPESRGSPVGWCNQHRAARHPPAVKVLHPRCTRQRPR